MKLSVPFFASVNSKSTIEELSSKADSLEKIQIGTVPWPEFAYTPDVSFVMAHGADCIVLKYFVIENEIRVVYGRSNQPVHKDACVEFFISFGNEKEYYNFEFNCIGTCLLGYGTDRHKRKLAAEEIIKKINTRSVITAINDSVTGCTLWELTVMIPFEVFYFHTFTSLTNRHCKANFYKCGDDLPQPHYLAWNNIETEIPDFHRPEYFGEIGFL